MSQTLSLQRSREELKRQGYATWIVEKPYNLYTKRREDLYNLFDLVGIREDVPGVTGIQACGQDLLDHLRKIMEGWRDSQGRDYAPNPHLGIWLRAGNRAFIWSWTLRGKKGRRKLYHMREIEFLISNGQVIHRLITKKENHE